jgi:hypothetical protein
MVRGGYLIRSIFGRESLTMSEKFREIREKHREFVEQQKIFFVGTAAPQGRVSVSPKGMDTLRVLGSNRVVWLNLSGAENEAAAHLLENDRLTLMFCAFEGIPLILRLFGHCRVIHPRDVEWNELSAMFPPIPGARQIMDLDVDLVLASCGKGVPYFDFVGERDDLKEWAARVGGEGLQSLWERKNQMSIDGKPTRIIVPESAAARQA